jgi:hypothetical protein
MVCFAHHMSEVTVLSMNRPLAHLLSSQIVSVSESYPKFTEVRQIHFISYLEPVHLRRIIFITNEISPHLTDRNSKDELDHSLSLHLPVPVHIQCKFSSPHANSFGSSTPPPMKIDSLLIVCIHVCVCSVRHIGRRE